MKKSTCNNGQPRWVYFDNRNILHYGYVDKFFDHGGTDITYFFRDEITNELSVLSGTKLKQAKRIY